MLYAQLQHQPPSLIILKRLKDIFNNRRFRWLCDRHLQTDRQNTTKVNIYTKGMKIWNIAFMKFFLFIQRKNIIFVELTILKIIYLNIA